MSHVLILGGDGYLGWPTATYFSARGYDVTVADNYFRRGACDELNTGMLYSVPLLTERAKIWYELTGYEIKVVIGDLAEPERMRGLVNGHVEYAFAIHSDFTGTPDTVIHYAEQPSAPYSMRDYKLADRTLANNLRVTNNLAWAVKDYNRDIHIIKLGTMGEYGTPNIDIEEGWLEVEHKGRSQKFLYPRQGGSLYHTTKVMDTDLLWFAVRMWGLKVTDLMQGPVYGNRTPETDLDPRLKTIFNYDEIFGTIINRFVVQAVVGYPLTVYGKGGQTRGYLNINDTLQCIHASEQTPAQTGELRIFNQIMETFSANEIADKVQEAGNRLGLNVTINHLENPRIEMETHYYNPVYQGLIDIGVEPHYLTSEVLDDLFQQVLEYKDNVRTDIIFRGIQWK